MTSDLQKWQFLRDAPARDAQSPEMRAMAGHLRAVASVSPWPAWAFANLAQAVARDLIVYVTDTKRVGREQIDGYTDPQGSTLAAIERGFDDCDASARAFVALCLAAGMLAEMLPWPSPEKLLHVYARVWCAGPFDAAHERWWTVETILDRARLGDMRDQIPDERDTGRWAYSGRRASMRAA